MCVNVWPWQRVQVSLWKGKSTSVPWQNSQIKPFAWHSWRIEMKGVMNSLMHCINTNCFILKSDPQTSQVSICAVADWKMAFATIHSWPFFTLMRSSIEKRCSSCSRWAGNCSNSARTLSQKKRSNQLDQLE